jgi:prepilin-type N-terminal cleavage/methylation domain-containing protein
MHHYALHQPHQTSARPRSHSGNLVRQAFTLVELLVSIALAVLLIAGVNEVFRLTTRTVSASNALSDVIRDNRGFQGALAADTHAAMIEDAPFFIIRSERVYAYRNQADLDSDKDGQIATADLNGDGIEKNIPVTTYNFRNHRIDVLAFFTSEFQHRQTGNDGTYVSPTTSYESYVNYSHMKVRNNSATSSGERATYYPDPGDAPTNTNPNPNNYFATQWLLGRSQILLLDSPPVTEGYIFNSDPDYKRDGTSQQTKGPISSSSNGNQVNPASGQNYLIQQHRFDLAQTSIARYRRRALLTNLNDTDWDTTFAYRFWTNPYSLKPVDSRQVSQAANVFLRGCTQFIVEYAGDFLDQRTDTDVFGHDGRIDFIRSGPTTNPRYKIRWYGAYRDTGGPGGPGADGLIDPAYDVVPLTKYITIPTAVQNVVQPWELVVPASPTVTNQNYTAAWRPYSLDKTNVNGYRPQLIRITVTLDEPNGKLTEGQTYEYIYKLGY